MKKLISIIIFVFLLVFISSCAQIIETNNYISKESVLEAIQSYKDTLYRLGASNNKDMSNSNSLSLETKIDKDHVVPYGNSSGIDLEWLDMAVIVLNFSEAITKSEYIFGDEVIIFDILEDVSMWGWSITDNTTVILSYIDNVLYLRVTDSNLIQTFYFQYNDDAKIEILRLYESISSEFYSLYIEDFVESTGLTFWSGYEEGTSYQIYTTINSEDGGSYTYSVSNDGDPQFQIANYNINDVNLVINDIGDSLRVYYDLYGYSGYNGFDIEGNLYYDDSLLNIDESIIVYPIFTEPKTYNLIIEKSLFEDDSLSLDAIQLFTEITVNDVFDNIAFLKDKREISTTYDYTLNYEDMLVLLGDMLYYNTHHIYEFRVIVHFETYTDDVLSDLVLFSGIERYLPSYGLTREGYRFVGWSLTENGELYDEEYITITEDTTLYALWEEIE